MRIYTIALFLAASTLCTATVIPSISFNELVSKSDQIVTGEVVRSWASWDAEHKVIWTRYEIRVEDTLKGSRGQTVIISEPGGKLNGIGMRVEGAVPYETGERVTLFLKTYPSGDNRTVGWTQGKFTTDGQGQIHPGIRDSTLSGITAGELRQRILTVPSRPKIQ